jgi:hypothetical protein
MPTLTTRLANVERTVAHDLSVGHVTTQLLRFARITALAAAAQLATTGAGDLGWKALAALLAGAAETAVRTVWPAVPIGTIITAVRHKGAAVEPPTPPAPPAEPTVSNTGS